MPRERPSSARSCGGTVGTLPSLGHDVFVNDISQTAVSAFVERGAVAVDSPEALAEAVDLIFPSLPMPADVLAVAQGENSLSAGFRSGST
jgi:3-hydroxyisobutyrate dehydrogenase